jgi:hypothetical protein
MRKKLTCVGGPRDGQTLTFLVTPQTPLPCSLSLTKTKWDQAFVYNLTFDEIKKKYYYKYIRTEKS